MTGQPKRKSFKIVVCGEGGIGKTTLLTAFQKGHFSESSMTLGLQPHILRFHQNNGAEAVALQIWDLGGQKHFFDMGVYQKYCQGAHAAIICFDLSELDTLEKLPQWTALLPPKIPKLLVGTKQDMGGDIAPLIEANIQKLGLNNVFVSYLETSTRCNMFSVYAVFKELLKHLCSVEDAELDQMIQSYTNLHVSSFTSYTSEAVLS